MKTKPLFMETTQIDALKTSSEIQAFLVQAGARQVLTIYDEHREISGLHFIIDMNGQSIPFKLPVRIDPIFNVINGRRKASGDRMQKAVADKEQAKRVAWRQLYRWVQAQLALIETGMVSAPEVFTPYIQTGPDETLYQRALNNGGFQKLLPQSVEG